ncbi:MAG: NitT/TauT family transport system substrate-binding protein [Burkholderiaceae bacterium]|jgi:NitT/TauT family transport system substrate-binding protein
MNKSFWKQFAIALVLFLAGYFTFNGSFFAGDKAVAPPLVQP